MSKLYDQAMAFHAQALTAGLENVKLLKQLQDFIRELEAQGDGPHADIDWSVVFKNDNSQKEK